MALQNPDVQTVLQCYPRIYFACHMRHVRDEAGEPVLSAHQASILDHLDDVEPTTMNDLARHLGVTASTMSLSVDRLVRGGYIARVRDPRDQRRVQLRLTEAGVAIKRRQKVLEPELVAAMLNRLQGEDRERALDGLRLLAEAASELIADAEFRRLRGGVA